MSSGRWWPFCLGLNGLTHMPQSNHCSCHGYVIWDYVRSLALTWLLFTTDYRTIWIVFRNSYCTSRWYTCQSVVNCCWILIGCKCWEFLVHDTWRQSLSGTCKQILVELKWYPGTPHTNSAHCDRIRGCAEHKLISPGELHITLEMVVRQVTLLFTGEWVIPRRVKTWYINSNYQSHYSDTSRNLIIRRLSR